MMSDKELLNSISVWGEKRYGDEYGVVSDVLYEVSKQALLGNEIRNRVSIIKSSIKHKKQVELALARLKREGMIVYNVDKGSASNKKIVRLNTMRAIKKPLVGYFTISKKLYDIVQK